MNDFPRVQGQNELFVSEVDFENVVKVQGFAYVFENGEQCNFVLMSLDFVYFVFLGRGLEAKCFL